jgi:glycosyltransferase involved in cell wall biosynthesis
MNASPLVSVVVIAFNAGRFLHEAIESVVSQTYGHWELLLIDDGSTDGSDAIARASAGGYPDRIRCFQHPNRANRGMSASRNLGIRQSTGELVAFLDADDAWFPRALEEQVGLLQQHTDAAMVYGPLSWWYSWTDAPQDRDRDYVEELGVPADTVVAPPTLLPLFLLDRAAVPSGMLLRRAAIEQVGGFEEEFRGEYEDQVFCAKVCLDLPVYASGRSWYRYRQHPDSAVAVGLRTGETRRARLTFLTWLGHYLRERGNDDPAVWRALRHELRRATHPRRHRTLTRIQRVTRRAAERLRSRV